MSRGEGAKVQLHTHFTSRTYRLSAAFVCQTQQFYYLPFTENDARPPASYVLKLGTVCTTFCVAGCHFQSLAVRCQAPAGLPEGATLNCPEGASAPYDVRTECSITCPQGTPNPASMKCLDTGNWDFTEAPSCTLPGGLRGNTNKAL